MRFAWATALPRPVQRIRTVWTNSGLPLGEVRYLGGTASSCFRIGFVNSTLRARCPHAGGPDPITIAVDGEVQMETCELGVWKRGSSSLLMI